MTLPRALALVWLATVAGAGLSRATVDLLPPCTEGSWTIDGGPVTVGPLAIHAIQLADDALAVSESCRAQRWELRRTGGLRALFVCRNPDQTARPRRFPLRLRARLTAACTRLDGAFAIRRRAGWIRFSATETGDCTTNTDCASGERCAKEPGACDARGHCSPPPLGCPDNVASVCGCDGATYFNACEAAVAGTNVAHTGECSAACGGIAGVPCPEGQFCELPAGQCGSADLDGHCVPTEVACPEYYSPVCGCDGVTYANECFRQAASAQKAHDGTCGGCTSLLDCLPNEFCQSPEGHCGTVPGACTFIQQACDGSEYDPVCGCDGETYANRCQAAMHAVSVAHTGACSGACGVIAGIPCPEGEFCDLPAGECRAADLLGECVPVSTVCPDLYAPVCGCDGVTYGNDCERRSAGAQKASDGECECVPVCCPPWATPFDLDHDGCSDVCGYPPCPIVVGGPPTCLGSCETSCDCYAKFGSAFCDDCPLLCPSCGNFWQCKGGTCVEQCGVFPLDVYTCTQSTCGGRTGC